MPATAVAEAAVFGVPDERLGEVPVAIIHRRDGSSLSEDDLRAFLDGRLAAFKMPARMIFCDEPLPRLGTGKIDRVALKQQYADDEAARDRSPHAADRRRRGRRADRRLRRMAAAARERRSRPARASRCSALSSRSRAMGG